MSNGTEYTDGTLNALLRINDQNLQDFEASNVIQPTNFYKFLASKSVPGTTAVYTLETGAASATFRAISNGVANSAGTELTVTDTLQILDASFYRDIALAQGYNGGVDAYMNRQTMKAVNAALATIEDQLINGSGNSSDGFYGLKDLVGFYDGMSLDAGGGAGGRVFMGISSEDDVCTLIGNDANFTAPDYQLMKVDTDSGTKSYPAYYQAICGYVGMQVAGKYSIAQGFNIDHTTDHVCDDDFLAQLYAKFPTSRAPMVNFILMDRLSWSDLRESRTATNEYGKPAPFSNTWDGAGYPIPIIVSDAMADDAAQLTTTTTTTTTAAG